MLRVGILGAGFFGAFHARAIAAVPDIHLVAVCADELALAEAFAAEHGGKPYGDWRALLDDRRSMRSRSPHPTICIARSRLPRFGRQALAGRKADGADGAECIRIIAAAEASRRQADGRADHALFVWPCLVAREILDSGELGRPVDGIERVAENSGWKPNRRGWHLDPATGGGMLMTAGIHALDMLVWLMGGSVSVGFGGGGRVVPRSKGRRQRHDAVAL